MTTDLIRQADAHMALNEGGTDSAATPPRHWRPEDSYTREQIELIKSAYVQGDFSDAEFTVFMQTAWRRGLDPLEGQITAVKRWNSRLKRETMQIQTTIDGSRLIAQSTGELAGIARPVWGPSTNGIPEWAEATVYRGKPGEAAATFTAVVWWEEFCQVDKDGKPTRFWKQMPRHMLYKVALSHALRSAFQKQLSGIYTDDEMAQADNQEGARAAGPAATPVQATAHVTEITEEPARVPMATPAQENAIRKLCTALGETEPQWPLPADEARAHITILTERYRTMMRESKPAQATTPAAAPTTADEKPQWNGLADVELRQRLNRRGYRAVEHVERFLASVRPLTRANAFAAIARMEQQSAESEPPPAGDGDMVEYDLRETFTEHQRP